MRNSATFAVVIAGLVAAADARAAEEKRTSSLAWVRLEGAEGCIAGTALARAVEERLGRKVFVSAADADITLEGSIGPAPPSGFRAKLRVTGRDGSTLGTREVETRSARCDAIDAKLALVVSVLIDPDAEGKPEPAPPPPAPPPEVIERERVVVVEKPPPSDPWRFELSLGAAGTLGLQPGVGLAFSPTVAILPPRFWGVLAGGGISLSTSADAERGAYVEASLAHGLLALCPLAGDRGRLRALACAGGFLGALRSRGVGFDTAQSSSSLTAGPLVTGRASFAIVGPLLVSVGAALLVPLTHAELTYRTTSGESTVFRTAAVAGMADLGIGVRLP
jgi:hypothetical protein